jgi:hypothetical protein
VERKGKKRSSDHQVLPQCEPCQAAAVWRGKKRSRDHQKYLQYLSEVKVTVKNPAVWTVSGGGCGERIGRKGQRDHQELCSANCVRRRLCGEERKKKKRSSRPASTCSADRVWRPLRGKGKQRTIKNLAVCTVSSGGCKERKER